MHRRTIGTTGDNFQITHPASSLVERYARLLTIAGSNSARGADIQADAPWRRFAAPRISSRNLHGTGCTLSAAMAAHLAFGATLEEAVVQARAFVRGAMAAGAQVQTGQGHGPLNHGFAPQPMRQTGQPAA